MKPPADVFPPDQAVARVREAGQLALGDLADRREEPRRLGHAGPRRHRRNPTRRIPERVDESGRITAPGKIRWAGKQLQWGGPRPRRVPRPPATRRLDRLLVILSPSIPQDG